MKKITLPKPNNFLYIGLLLMIIKVSFSLSEIIIYSDFADTLLSLISASCFCIYILQQKYTMKLLVLYILMGSAIIYSSLKADSFNLLITVLVCLAIRKEDINKVINFIFKYELLFLCVHTGVALLRSVVLDEALSTVIDGINRYHFGMGHPNRFSIYLFNLIIMWLFLNFYHLSILKVSGVGIIIIGTYFFTKTRTHLVEIIVLIMVLFIIILFSKKGQELVRKVAMLITPVISCVVMLLVSSYTNKKLFIHILDQLLSARIRLGAYALEYNGITMLGQRIQNDITWNETWRIDYITFDNIYTYLCINQGLVWLVIIVVLFFLLAKRSDSRFHFAIIAWSLYGITEVHGLNGFMCFPILLLSTLFQTEGKETIKNKQKLIEVDRGQE